MGFPTLQLPQEKIQELQSHLKRLGFTFEDRAHQVFLARKGGAVVNLYESGKIVLGGSDNDEIDSVFSIATSLGASEVEKVEKELPPLDITGTRIGTDEVGKGDYFGPLIVAGVLVTDETAKNLESIGVIDSKRLSDTTVSNLATQVKKICGPKCFDIVVVSPLKYNILMKKMRNLNKLLGWAHARVVENLANNGYECELAVADQFGDPGYIQEALMAKGRKMELEQMPKAEREVSVASASILARNKFLWKLEDLSDTYGVEFPKGASHVVEFGKKLVEEHGIDILPAVAKLHFKTTQQITEGKVPKIPEQVEAATRVDRVSRTLTERDQEDYRLECYDAISVFEAELRSFIERHLSHHFGDEWWDECIPENVKGKAERLAKAEKEKGKSSRLVDYLDFSHYQWIITLDKNWEKVFKKSFKHKEQLIARLAILKNYRNIVAHSRGKITREQKGEIIGAIRYLRGVMRLSPRLEDFV